MVERMYIKIYYLKILHYFFFSLGVFSMTAGVVFFDFVTFESLNFFVLGYFYCLSSLMVAYYYYKDYKQSIEPIKIVRFYLIPYLVLVFWTVVCMLVLVWAFPSVIALVYSFLYVDYYIFFFILVGFIVSRFKIVSKFFDMYNIFVLQKAMGAAKEHAIYVDVGKYSIGSDPEMDEILDEIWAHRDYPLPYIRKLEIAICEKDIIDINNMMTRIKERGVDAMDEKIVKHLEKMKDNYLEKIGKIREKVD